MRWDNHPDKELELSRLYDKYGNNYNQIISELNNKFPEYDFTEFSRESLADVIGGDESALSHLLLVYELLLCYNDINT